MSEIFQESILEVIKRAGQCLRPLVVCLTQDELHGLSNLLLLAATAQLAEQFTWMN